MDGMIYVLFIWLSYSKKLILFKFGFGECNDNTRANS